MAKSIYSNINPIVSELSKFQIDLLKDLVSFNKEFIDSFKDQTDKEKRVTILLIEHGWAIHSNMSLTDINYLLSLDQKSPEINKNISAVFVKSFKKKIESMDIENYDIWKSNKYLNPKVQTIKSHLLTIQKTGIEESSLAIIPGLHSLIEGLLYDIVKIITESNCKTQKEKLEKSKKLLQNDKSVSDEAMHTLIFDVLFQKTHGNEAKPINTWNFTRNLPSHGEAYNYGGEENVVRCFVIIDYLVNFILKINSKKSQS